jgi:protein-S-isoprenylcysteine O-methyltransferase Ste14
MHALSLLCWGAFVGVWIAGYLYNRIRAPRAVRTGSGSGLGAGLSWVVGAAAVLLIKALPEKLWAAISFASPTLEAIGLFFLLVSTAFTLWARWTLGTMWTSAPTIKEYHQLRTNGPYRVTRHPIYTGLLGMVFGTMLLEQFGVMLPIMALFVVYVVQKIRSEEQLLLDAFGERYRRYQGSVPAVIPFLPVLEELIDWMRS